MGKRKVIYSPGYGAGWSSWATHCAKELATDPALAELVDQGKVTIGVEGCDKDPSAWVHPEFLARVKEICGDRLPYFGGIDRLTTTTVDGAFRIEDHDGYEAVLGSYEDWW